MLLVTVIKNLVSNPEMQFPFPLLVSALANGGTAVLAFLWMQNQRGLLYANLARKVGLPAWRVLACFARGVFHVRPRLGHVDFKEGILPIGLFLGFEIGLTNTALSLLSVSVRTMVHACGPAAVLGCAWFFGLEKLTLMIQCVILLVIGGGVLSAGASAAEVSPLGLCLEVASLFVQGLRWSITQKLLTAGHHLALDEEDRAQVLARICGRTISADSKHAPAFAAMYPAAGHVESAVTEHLLRHPSCRHRDEEPLSPSKAPPAERRPLAKVEPARGLFAAMYPDRGNVKKRVEEEIAAGLLLRAESAPVTSQAAKDLESAEGARIGSRVAHVSKIEIAAYVNPITASVCLILSLVFEPEAFAKPAIGWLGIGLNIACLSVGVLLNMVLELSLVHHTSAFALSLAGVMHNVLIVIASVLIFGDVLVPTALSGFVITNMGVALYAWHKHHDSK